jgi:hypothetical protein
MPSTRINKELRVREWTPHQTLVVVILDEARSERP